MDIAPQVALWIGSCSICNSFQRERWRKTPTDRQLGPKAPMLLDEKAATTVQEKDSGCGLLFVWRRDRKRIKYNMHVHERGGNSPLFGGIQNNHGHPMVERGSWECENKEFYAFTVAVELLFAWRLLCTPSDWARSCLVFVSAKLRAQESTFLCQDDNWT